MSYDHIVRIWSPVEKTLLHMAHCAVVSNYDDISKNIYRIDVYNEFIKTIPQEFRSFKSFAKIYSRYINMDLNERIEWIKLVERQGFSSDEIELIYYYIEDTGDLDNDRLSELLHNMLCKEKNKIETKLLKLKDRKGDHKKKLSQTVMYDYININKDYLGEMKKCNENLRQVSINLGISLAQARYGKIHYITPEFQVQHIHLLHNLVNIFGKENVYSIALGMSEIYGKLFDETLHFLEKPIPPQYNPRKIEFSEDDKNKLFGEIEKDKKVSLSKLANIVDKTPDQVLWYINKNITPWMGNWNEQEVKLFKNGFVDTPFDWKSIEKITKQNDFLECYSYYRRHSNELNVLIGISEAEQYKFTDQKKMELDILCRTAYDMLSKKKQKVRGTKVIEDERSFFRKQMLDIENKYVKPFDYKSNFNLDED